MTTEPTPRPDADEDDPNAELVADYYADIAAGFADEGIYPGMTLDTVTRSERERNLRIAEEDKLRSLQGEE